MTFRLRAEIGVNGWLNSNTCHTFLNSINQLDWFQAAICNTFIYYINQSRILRNFAFKNNLQTIESRTYMLYKICNEKFWKIITYIKLDTPYSSAFQWRSCSVQILPPKSVKFLHSQRSSRIMAGMNYAVFLSSLNNTRIDVQSKLEIGTKWLKYKFSNIWALEMQYVYITSFGMYNTNPSSPVCVRFIVLIPFARPTSSNL